MATKPKTPAKDPYAYNKADTSWVTQNTPEITAAVDAWKWIPAPIIPATTEPTPTTVIKTSALQARIDARNKAQTPVIDQSQPTIPTTPEEQSAVNAQKLPQWDQPPAGYKYGSTIDSSTGKPELIKIEPATTETTPEPVVTPEPVKTEPTEPVKTPEEQAKIDAATVKAEEDKAKVDADKAAVAAKEAAAAKNWEQVTNTQDEAFAVLSAGGTLQKNMKNAAFIERYKAYQKLNGLTNQSLASMNANGELDSKYLDYLSKSNPTRFSELNKLTDSSIKINSINSDAESLYNGMTGKKTETKLKLDKVDQDIASVIYGDKPSIRDLRKQYLEDNTKIKDLKVGLAEKGAEREELEDARDQIYQNLRKTHPDTPKSTLMGMAAGMTRDINDQIKTVVRQENLLFAEYQAEKEEANAMMNFEMQVVAEERADRAETIKFMQDKFNTLKGDEMWQKEKDYQTDAATKAYDRGDIQAAKAHERNKEMLDLGQDFQKEESRLQRDQAMEIVKMQMKNSGIETDIIQNADWSYTRTTYNKDTGKTTNEIINPPAVGQDPVQANDGSQVTYQTDDNGNLTVDFWPVWVAHNPLRTECGQWANDKAGLWVWDSYQSKIDATKARKDRQPQVWDSFVTNGGLTLANWEKSGHIGFVKTVFPDGSIEVVESNYKTTTDKNGKKIGIVSTRIIWPNDKGRSDISFGATKFSKWGIDWKKDIEQWVVKDALENISVKAWAKWAEEGQREAFIGSIQRNWVGSEQVKWLLNSIISKDEWKAWWDMRMAVTGMEKIKSDIEKYQEQYPWEMFWFSGSLQARIDKTTSSLSNSSLDPATKAKIQLESNILVQLQNYRRAVTGAAASELESKEYRELFSKWGDSADVSLAKITALADEFKRIESQKQKEYLGWEPTYNYIIQWQKPWSQPQEVSIASVVWDPKYPLSDEAQKSFWNNFQDPSTWWPMNSFSEFMFWK